MLLVRHSKKIVRHVRGSDDISTTLLQGQFAHDVLETKQVPSPGLKYGTLTGTHFKEITHGYSLFQWGSSWVILTCEHERVWVDRYGSFQSL